MARLEQERLEWEARSKQMEQELLSGRPAGDPVEKSPGGRGDGEDGSARRNSEQKRIVLAGLRKALSKALKPIPANVAYGDTGMQDGDTTDGTHTASDSSDWEWAVRHGGSAAEGGGSAAEGENNKGESTASEVDADDDDLASEPNVDDPSVTQLPILEAAAAGRARLEDEGSREIVEEGNAAWIDNASGVWLVREFDRRTRLLNDVNLWEDGEINILGFDGCFRCIYAGEGTGTHVGCRSAEYLGITQLDAVHPGDLALLSIFANDDAPLTQQLGRAALQGGACCRRRRADGGMTHLERIVGLPVPLTDQHEATDDAAAVVWIVVESIRKPAPWVNGASDGRTDFQRSLQSGFLRFLAQKVVEMVDQYRVRMFGTRLALRSSRGDGQSPSSSSPRGSPKHPSRRSSTSSGIFRTSSFGKSDEDRVLPSRRHSLNVAEASRSSPSNMPPAFSRRMTLQLPDSQASPNSSRRSRSSSVSLGDPVTLARFRMSVALTGGVNQTAAAFEEVEKLEDFYLRGWAAASDVAEAPMPDDVQASLSLSQRVDKSAPEENVEAGVPAEEEAPAAEEEPPSKQAEEAEPEAAPAELEEA